MRARQIKGSEIKIAVGHGGPWRGMVVQAITAANISITVKIRISRQVLSKRTIDRSASKELQIIDG